MAVNLHIYGDSNDQLLFIGCNSVCRQVILCDGDEGQKSVSAAFIFSIIDRITSKRSIRRSIMLVRVCLGGDIFGKAYWQIDSF